MPTIDWAALEAAYISQNVTQRELGKQFGVPAGSIGPYAVKNEWERKRAEWQKARADEALEAAAVKRRGELTEFNNNDLMAAKALRAKAARMLKDEDQTPANLRSIAAVFESAQRIGRLALGAETERSVVQQSELPASVHDFV